MNLDHLEIFVDTVETHNFRKTAERKHISQPAVSQAINSLEHEIGVKLLSRSRSGVKPTQDGLVFYQDAKSLINNYYKALQNVQSNNEEKAKVTIGITSSPNENQFLPQILQHYSFKHPHQKIYLQTSNHETLKKQLFNENSDIILTTKDDFKDLKQVKYIELTIGYFCAVVPKTYSLANKTQLEPENLNNTNIIMLDSSWCPPKQFELQQLITKNNSNLNISYVTDVSTAYLMCKSSLGISIMPNFIAGKSTNLVTIIPIKYNINLSYGIVKLKPNHANCLDRFITYLKEGFLTYQNKH
ncbi:LysR family transcriptional regulator [Lactobacillus sp. PSON]|uniref:LysR family transcriptional regulator n=1 Tax=Lactobacillus sp. PSON TaxID=3455454 RepID=UPI004042C0F4